MIQRSHGAMYDSLHGGSGGLDLYTNGGSNSRESYLSNQSNDPGAGLLLQLSNPAHLHPGSTTGQVQAFNQNVHNQHMPLVNQYGMAPLDLLGPGQSQMAHFPQQLAADNQGRQPWQSLAAAMTCNSSSHGYEAEGLSAEQYPAQELEEAGEAEVSSEMSESENEGENVAPAKKRQYLSIQDKLAAINHMREHQCTAAETARHFNYSFDRRQIRKWSANETKLRRLLDKGKKTLHKGGKKKPTISDAVRRKKRFVQLMRDLTAMQDRIRRECGVEILVTYLKGPGSEVHGVGFPEGLIARLCWGDEEIRHRQVAIFKEEESGQHTRPQYVAPNPHEPPPRPPRSQQVMKIQSVLGTRPGYGRADCRPAWWPEHMDWRASGTATRLKDHERDWVLEAYANAGPHEDEELHAVQLLR